MGDKNVIGFGAGYSSGVGPTYRRILSDKHELQITAGAIGDRIPEDLWWNLGGAYNLNFKRVENWRFYVSLAGRVAGNAHEEYSAPAPRPVPEGGYVKPTEPVYDSPTIERRHDISLGAGVGVGVGYTFSNGISLNLTWPQVNAGYDLNTKEVGLSYWPSAFAGFQF